MDLPKTYTSTAAAPCRRGLRRTLAVMTMAALLLGAGSAVAAPASATAVQAASTASTEAVQESLDSADLGAVNATNGSGGTYRDARDVAYSNGESSSSYHLYAGHLDGEEPHGIVFYLHGDGAVEYQWPESGAREQYLELAREHSLMLVMPRTPDRVGSDTWWEGEESVEYAADLLDHLGTQYNLDLNQVYWTGLSGGSDVIAGKLMKDHSDGWTGGAAIMVAGGGAWGAPGQSISDSLKSNFSMHWVVGSRDTPAAGGSSGDFNALAAAERGESHYEAYGLDTSLTIVPGLTHFNVGPEGPAKLAEILERR